MSNEPVPIHRSSAGYADVVGGYPFNTVGSPLTHGPFWATDETAWDAWLDQIAEAIAEHDPWALLVERPDCDKVIVDVLDGWSDRVRRFNGRTVWLLRPVGWEP